MLHGIGCLSSIARAKAQAHEKKADAYEAQQELLNLKAAMADPKSATSRATILEVSESLADHQDDAAYLQAFMAGGGMDQAARAAAVLHDQDGTHDSQVPGVMACTGAAMADLFSRPVMRVMCLWNGFSEAMIGGKSKFAPSAFGVHCSMTAPWGK